MLMTFQACPPNPADVRGQLTYVLGPQKSHSLPIIQWEVWGRERSSVIGTLSARVNCVISQGARGEKEEQFAAILRLKPRVLKMTPAVFPSRSLEPGTQQALNKCSLNACNRNN